MEERLDQSVDPWASPLLDGSDEMKLAVFGINLSGGNSATTADGTIKVNWPEQVRIAQAAEAAGFDAIVSAGRWKGYGGLTNYHHRSFDTITWAAGLAAVTERIQLFATTHVPTIHPVRAAKAIATADHISGGRIGLNIVAGWNEGEIAMFGSGQLEHNERYDVADEWLGLIERLWQATEPFDYAGRYYNSPQAYSSPRPVQTRPAIMSAGVSPRGQQFAAEHADIIFALVHSTTMLPEIIESMRRLSAARERRIKIFLPTYVVCADTDAEAEAYWNYYVHEKGDWAAARTFIETVSGATASRSLTREEWASMATDVVAGGGGTPLIGSAETVVRGIRELADAGVDGITVTWVNFEEGIDYFARNVNPLLVQAGLRSARE